MSIEWVGEKYSYVACLYGEMGDEPGDCFVRVGEDEEGWWVDDGDDTVRVDLTGPYDTEEEARKIASELADRQDEAEPGENAEGMRYRLLSAQAGDPSEDGVYAVYWRTSLDDSGPRERYVTRKQAEAAAELANDQLHELHPGTLLCGYVVAELISGEWRLFEYE